MKKPFKNTDLSQKRCTDCGRRLKKNFVTKKPKADLCYKCFHPKDLRRRGVQVQA
jgi:hypothetical protein